jgi:hypothetical protein
MVKLVAAGTFVVRPLEKDAQFTVDKKTKLGNLTFYGITDEVARTIVLAARKSLAGLNLNPGA